MTGEVGTGKTLLVRCLLQLLNQSDVAYAYVFNSRLSPVEFLQYIAGDFGLNVAGKNKSELLLVLSNYVISRHQKKLTTVLSGRRSTPCFDRSARRDPSSDEP